MLGLSDWYVWKQETMKLHKSTWTFKANSYSMTVHAFNIYVSIINLTLFLPNTGKQLHVPGKPVKAHLCGSLSGFARDWLKSLKQFFINMSYHILTWSQPNSDSPGAGFCTGLSFWLGTTYLPEKVWLQKCNPGIFCNTPRYFAQSNCGSSFAVGRHLWTYPTLNEA